VILLLVLFACSGGGGGGGDAPGTQGGDDTAPEGVGVLPGDADDAAWDAVPQLDIPDPDLTSMENVGGVYVFTDRVALLIDEDATVSQINALASELDATLIGADPRVGRLVLQLPEDADLEAALAAADEAAGVTTAAPSLSLSPQALPPAHDSPTGLAASDAATRWRWEADPAGANWGLDYVHAPAVWNLREALIANDASVPAIIVAEYPWSAHQDVDFVSDFWTRYAPATTADDAGHAMAVMGLIAARWDSGGIEAVMPADGTRLHAPVDAIIYDLATVHTTDAQTQGRFLDRIEVAALDDRPAVLNLSAGSYPVTCESGDGGYVCTYKTLDEMDEILDRAGDDWAAWARRVDAYVGSSAWLMACSAGNTHVSSATATGGGFSGLVALDYSARHNSGCGNAAERDLSDHFLAVEALSRGGARWDENNPNGSASGGDLAAPGDDVGHLAGTTDAYGQGDGTSYAAPMVASTAVVLWTLDPYASLQDVRAALLTGAGDAVGGTAPALDAWGAVRALADARELDLSLWLSDFDDGTLDGALRQDPRDGSVVAFSEARGDGCVDMRDLRAFRDGLWDARRDGHDGLNGGLDHLGRDGNRDGANGWLTEDSWVPQESVGSRYDLDGDGDVSFLDVAVMAEAWGRCRDGAARSAETEGHADDALEGLTNSVDVWIEATVPLRVQASRQAGESIDPATSAARMLGDLFLKTVPLDVCAPLEVRAGNAVWAPTDPSPGMDHVLTTESVGSGEGASLAYLRSGPGIDETPIHLAPTDSYFSGAPLDYTILSSPGGGQVAGSGSGRLEVTDRDGVLTQIPIPDLSDDTTPWSWLADGSGVLVRATDGWGEDSLAYVDVEHEVGWRLGEGVDLHWLDAPTLSPAGDAFFVGQDRVLYRQRVLAPPPPLDIDELLGWVEGTVDATCTDGSGEAPEALLDLDAAVGEAYLVHASPTAASPDGGKLLLKAPNSDGTWDMLIADVDGVTLETVVEGWVPRGAADTVWEIWPSDAVAWLPNSKGLVYVDVDGVHRVTWETAGVPTLAQTSVGLISSRVGPLVVSPDGAHLVVGEYRGPASALYLDLFIVSLDGATEIGPMVNRVQRGLPTWSSDGAYLAYAEAGSSTVSDLVVVTHDGTEVLDTRDWMAPSGTNSTVERFPTWAADMQGW
jgi:hypothetical protein